MSNKVTDPPLSGQLLRQECVKAEFTIKVSHTLRYSRISD